jgi:hypothetical protein
MSRIRFWPQRCARFACALALACPTLACSQNGNDRTAQDNEGDGIETDDSQTDDDSDGQDSADEETNDPTSSESADDDAGDDDDDLPELKFDLTHDIDLSDEGEIGCKAVDFLFVVDNSGSMQDEQVNLTQSFPGFMAAIRETLQARDFHLMVIDSDAANSASSSQNCSGTECTCTPAPDCCKALCASGTATICNDKACDDQDGLECSTELGGGRTTDGSGNDCNFAGDRRYVTESQPDLDDAFACAATVGTAGDGKEQMAGAMARALSPQLLDTEQCNEGFLRDDSILVVILITDEDDKGEENPDGGSPGDPEDWYQNLLAAKGGATEEIVVIGFIGDLDLPAPICKALDPNGGTTGAEPSPRLRTFIEKWGDFGMAASVCADDYGPAFAEAVSIIDGACDNWPPK